jgi:NAD(P)H-hydrate epimerase
MTFSGGNMTTKLVTVKEMRAIEDQANQAGFSYDAMMQKAGRGVAEVIRHSFSNIPGCAVGLIGSGNNGGDALVALTALLVAGWQGKAYLQRPRSMHDPILMAFTQAGGESFLADDDASFSRLATMLDDADVLIDGLLGTGVKLPLKPDYAAVMAFIKGLPRRPFTVAVDCPSGVDCDNGAAAAEVFPVDLTVCMQAIKTGLVRSPAIGLCGQIQVVSLGLPDGLSIWEEVQDRVMMPDDVKAALPDRPATGHKGTFGTVLIAAGSTNFTGAPVLAAKGAYRGGVGLVRLAVPASIQAALAGSLLETTWLLLPHQMGVIAAEAAQLILSQLKNADAFLLGPGLGTEDTTAGFVGRLFDPTRHIPGHAGIGFINSSETTLSETITFPPTVIDADGLRLIAKIPDWHKFLPAETILTPHPGEMAALCGLPVEEIQEDRVGIARKMAQKWGVVLLLKGAGSVIAGPDGRVAIIPIATSALAKAGTGDVLAGLIAGLRAQGVDAFSAAATGAWIHARAGQITAEELGTPVSVLASEVADSLLDVFSDLV